MKILTHLGVTAIIFILISKISVDNYNAAIYGVFAIIVSYLLYSQLKQVHDYNSKKSKVCTGKIISFKEDENNSRNYDIDVQFSSPYDGTEYVIKSKIAVLPENKQVEVIFNEKNPNTSKIYIKPRNYQFVLLIISILFFLYQFVRAVL